MSERTLIGSSWWSTALRRVFLIERIGAVDSLDEIFVFRATDRNTAFQRALEIGRNREESYVNGDGDRVVWRFAEVVTLDELRADDLDGVEVYCVVLGAPSSDVSFNAVFRPDESEPGMTGV